MGNARNIAFWVVLFLLILALFNLFSGGQSTMSSNEVAYSDFVSQVEDGDINSAEIDGERVLFRSGDGRTFFTIVPPGTDVTEALIANDVNFSA
ncbi:MAG: ATP-dependent metallopeptidase FtsH/Yme1/Tma family protein, partial [Pseudomonadota bacterium]